MADTTLFSDDIGVRVTTSLVTVPGRTYAMDDITSVDVQSGRTPNRRAIFLLIGAIGFTVALLLAIPVVYAGVFTGEEPLDFVMVFTHVLWFIIGVLTADTQRMKARRSTYTVMINGESVLVTPDITLAYWLEDAIWQAKVLRGPTNKPETT
mgnify:FL=1|jgi:uncharacterized membrane protein YccC